VFIMIFHADTTHSNGDSYSTRYLVPITESLIPQLPTTGTRYLVLVNGSTPSVNLATNRYRTGKWL